MLFGVVDQEPDELQALVRFHLTVFPQVKGINLVRDLVIQIDRVSIVRAAFPGHHPNWIDVELRVEHAQHANGDLSLAAFIGVVAALGNPQGLVRVRGRISAG